MPRRRGRPGLVGTMARTAVVAGTATAVSGGMVKHSQKKQQAAYEQNAANQAAYESQAQLADMQAQLDATQSQPAPQPAGVGRQQGPGRAVRRFVQCVFRHGLPRNDRRGRRAAARVHFSTLLVNRSGKQRET